MAPARSLPASRHRCRPASTAWTSPPRMQRLAGPRALSPGPAIDTCDSSQQTRDDVATCRRVRDRTTPVEGLAVGRRWVSMGGLVRPHLSLDGSGWAGGHRRFPMVCCFGAPSGPVGAGNTTASGYIHRPPFGTHSIRSTSPRRAPKPATHSPDRCRASAWRFDAASANTVALNTAAAKATSAHRRSRCDQHRRDRWTPVKRSRPGCTWLGASVSSKATLLASPHNAVSPRMVAIRAGLTVPALIASGYSRGPGPQSVRKGVRKAERAERRHGARTRRHARRRGRGSAAVGRAPVGCASPDRSPRRRQRLCEGSATSQRGVKGEQVLEIAGSAQGLLLVVSIAG